MKDGSMGGGRSQVKLEGSQNEKGKKELNIIEINFFRRYKSHSKKAEQNQYDHNFYTLMCVFVCLALIRNAYKQCGKRNYVFNYRSSKS